MIMLRPWSCIAFELPAPATHSANYVICKFRAGICTYVYGIWYMYMNTLGRRKRLDALSQSGTSFPVALGCRIAIEPVYISYIEYKISSFWYSSMKLCRE